jgi:hypothetical protein
VHRCDDGKVKWRVITWLAVAIAVAAAIGLGADTAIDGTASAAGLAGVIAGFCELGALTLGVAGWAGQRREPGERPAPGGSLAPERGAEKSEEASATQTDTPGKYVVDARQAQGVQIGDGNVQHNDFRGGLRGLDER